VYKVDQYDNCYGGISTDCDWNVVQVMVLNSSWDAHKLQGAKVEADGVACESMPTLTKPAQWYRVNCGPGASKGLKAKSIKITSAQNDNLHMCGVRVYGYQTKVFF
jgi:hypothetical protein